MFRAVYFKLKHRFIWKWLFLNKIRNFIKNLKRRASMDFTLGNSRNVLSVKKMPDNFPLEIDLSFYRSFYPDLRQFSDESLLEHYETHGRKEGRMASPAAKRENFISFIVNYEHALEIGPFNRPIISGPNVKYFDVLIKSELEDRAVKLFSGTPSADWKIPEIHFVSKTGNLEEVKGVFDVVVSSHNIEHQPDLVSHLCNVERLLQPNGCYCLLIPDCRFCFDYFISPSTIAKVLEAYYEKRRRHTLGSVLEHFALIGHNDPERYWKKDVGVSMLNVASLKAAIREWETAGENYIDVHAWQFTPENFRQIITLLYDLGLIKFRIARVYDTPFGRGEFCVVLYKGSS